MKMIQVTRGIHYYSRGNICRRTFRALHLFFSTGKAPVGVTLGAFHLVYSHVHLSLYHVFFIRRAAIKAFLPIFSTVNMLQKTICHFLTCILEGISPCLLCVGTLLCFLTCRGTSSRLCVQFRNCCCPRKTAAVCR